MIIETMTGYIAVTRKHLEEMNRESLQEYLEARGYAVYEDESTELLRETALDDFDGEAKEK